MNEAIRKALQHALERDGDLHPAGCSCELCAELRATLAFTEILVGDVAQTVDERSTTKLEAQKDDDMDAEELQKKIVQISHVVFTTLVYVALCGWLAITVAGWLYVTYLKHFGGS